MHEIMWWAIAGFVGVGLVLYAVGIYNGLIRLKHAVDQAWANIDVLLKQRHDELPKLVDTVKGYMKHERELLSQITELRAAVRGARNMRERSEADGALHSALGQLFALSEGYPELKADSSFKMLETRISEIEEQIADRREYYNHSVNALNVRIEQIPDVIVARIMALGSRELFEASARERPDVKISF